MEFDDIHLVRAEKRSLFSFHFCKRQRQEEIECFHSLYHEYQLIEQNYADIRDAFNYPVHDGTYSISMRYLRYKVYRREKRIHNLPNWVAITISLLSFLLSVFTFLSQ